MELIWRYLCVIICLQSVSCEEDDDTVLSMLNYISISLARIARKQRLMDKRIDSLAANMKNNELIDGKQENVVPVATSGKDAKEDLFIMRRAISSEKEYVRNLVESMSADIGGRIAAVEASSDYFGDKIAAVEATSDDLSEKIAEFEATSDGVRTRVDTMETSIATLESAAANVDCYTVGYSQMYKGRHQHSKSGIYCQRWDAQSPHGHTRNNIANFPDTSLTAAANYCRDPDLEGGEPWCYTTNRRTRWERCGVQAC